MDVTSRNRPPGNRGHGGDGHGGGYRDDGDGYRVDPRQGHSRGPRRYGPNSADPYAGGDPRYGTDRRGHRGAWSDVGGDAWDDPALPTRAMPLPPRDAYRGSRPPVPGPGRHLPPPPPPGRRRQGPPGGGRPPRHGRGVVFGRVVSALVATALVLVTGTVWAISSGGTKTSSDANNNAGDVGVVTETTDENGNVVPVTVKGSNILIVGTDARTDASGNPLTPEELKTLSPSLRSSDGVNTDTMMILHIPDGGGKATAISIPRDTWMGDDVVHAPGVVGPYSDGTEGQYKANKINSFYGSAREYEAEYLLSQGVTDQAERLRKANEAGRTMLIKVLQQFTGVKIDHYAEVNLIGFYLLSQAVGGVPVCLVKATKDRQSGANFPAGHFEVEGSDALAFVRQRHGLPGGDFDRVRRQQAFLAGAANKILSVGTLTSPSKLSKLIDAANRSVVLDKGFDLLSFAQQMVGLSSGNINFVTLPTAGPQKGVGTDALATDPAKVRAFFAGITSDSGSSSTSSIQSDAPPVDRSAVTVDVQNGTETAGMAAAIGQTVASAGFERGQLTDYPGTTEDNQQKSTTVRYPAGGEAAAAEVLKVIKVGSTVADDSVPEGHIVVVVGTDMPHPGTADSTTSAATPTTTSPTKPAPAGGDALPSDAINAADPGCVN